MRINFDETDLVPIIERTITVVLDRLDNQRSRFGSRIGYTEPEAAALIGVKPHILADARRRGEISAKLVGKRYVYSRETLERYLEEDD